MDDDPVRRRRLPQLPGEGGHSPAPPMLRAPASDDISSSYHGHFSPSMILPPPAHPAARFTPGSGYYHVTPAPAPAPGGGGVVWSHHSRSLSQPQFFSMDFLAPPPYADLAAPAPIAFSQSPAPSSSYRGLPPLRAGHRRSQSDILGFSQTILQMPPPAPVNPEANNTLDGLVGSYISPNSLGVVGTSGDATQEPRDNLESQVRGPRAWSPAGSSDNEAESVNGSMPQHCRSLSMDSFIGKLSLGQESSNLPPPSPGAGAAIGLSRSGSGSIGGAATLFASNLGNGEFSEAEKKKIMTNERLAEIVLIDPKRVKRILNNRVSAAKSKERKIKYMSELERKIQVLQMETTTLTTQVTTFQRDHSALSIQNNELKIRLQAMEQQAYLKDALNEALNSEVQRLKLVAGEISDSHMPNGSQQQSSQMIQLQQLQKLKQESQTHHDQQQQLEQLETHQRQWNF